METASLIQLAACGGGAGAMLALLARGRAVLLAGLVVLAAGGVGLAVALVPGDDLADLVAGPVRVGALALGAALVAALALGLARFQVAVPVALLVAAPFRIPVEVGAQDAFLLVPLYVVLAAAALALAGRALTGREVVPVPALLAVPAALFVGLASVSALWSSDVEASAVDLLFFYLPFSLLVAVAARVPLVRRLGAALGVAIVVVAVALAGVGLWQLHSRELVFARDLEVGNAYASFFRTTSLFGDPSIYGRHLVVAILVVLVALWLTRLSLLAGTAVIAFLCAGLYFTYSQSSVLALAAGVVFVAAVAGSGRGRIVVLAGSLGPLLLAGAILAATAQDESLRRLTSGRSELVANAAEITRDHPIAGVGVGAEEKASEELPRARARSAQPSHTTPMTVAAELGALGLAAYLLFMAGSVRLLYLAWLRERALAVALAAVFLAVTVHSLFYSGFFEDPVVWLSLAVAAAAATAPLAAPAPRTALRAERSAVARPAVAAED